MNNPSLEKREDFQFFRKGKTNSFKEELPEKVIKKLKEWEDLNLEKYGIDVNELYGI